MAGYIADSPISYLGGRMTIEIPQTWPQYVAGVEGITYEARRALNTLVHLSDDRIAVFHAAMRGREWMYHYQAGEFTVRRQWWGCCEPNDYWRSVVEAVQLAVNARDCQKEIAYFLAPIPNSAPQWAAPTTLADKMEGV